jgi:4-alpha-glucanotransferase
VSSALHALAGALGIEPARPTGTGDWVPVPDETLLALCRALGADVVRAGDAPGALVELTARKLAEGTEPVSVAWDGAAPVLTLYRAAARVEDDFDVRVELEDDRACTWSRVECRVTARAEPGEIVALEVTLPYAPPFGAHTVTVTGSRRTATVTVLAAPRRPRARLGDRAWGLFAPLYALHDAASTTGDLGTLRRFAAWAATHGADAVGTLPILATFVGHGDEPCDPSPYAPVSRTFWNETYLDLADLGVPPIVERRGGERTVDLPALARTRRRMLEPLARAGESDPDLHRWRDERPDVTGYARFRAKLEGSGASGVRYHEYVQWQCERQLDRLARALDASGQALHLDFPVGTHRLGYDVARDPELFVRDVSVGAPPDAFQAHGQNWGFPPVHPQRARRAGHAYLRDCLTAHLRFSRLLRLDHVMGLDRLWFVPEGAPATDGAYVSAAAEEQWAAVCLVADRYEARIVGEDLGTVPAETELALRDHDALGMWVTQFQIPARGRVNPPTAQQLACTGTHDLPTFATWWQDLDAARRATLIRTVQLSNTDATEVLRAVYAWLGASDAAIVIATLEDLWLEHEAQNRPGTPASENFRNRAAHAIDDFDAVPSVPRLLTALDTARRSSMR